MPPIWLVSYPKSGNTWMRLALGSLAAGGAPVDLSTTDDDRYGVMLTLRSKFDHYCGVQSEDLTPAEIIAVRPWLNQAILADLPPDRIVKIHDACGTTPDGTALFPTEGAGKILYLVRDPRDVALSWAAFNSISAAESVAFLGNAGATIGTAAHHWRPQIPQGLGCWSDHVTSWIDAPDFPNRLVIRYEDMIADSMATLGRVADFLGWTVTKAQLAAALDAARFDRLQAQEQQKGFSERPPRSGPFFRQGRVGGWRDYLPEPLQARILADHGAIMERLGYLPA